MMRNTLSNHLKLMLLLLALGLADSPAIAEPEHRKQLDKDHLLGDFGTDPSEWKQGGVIHSKSGPIQNWPMVPGKKIIPEEFQEPNRHIWGDFGPHPYSLPKAQGKPKHGTLPEYTQMYKLPEARQKELSATDINHLRKAKDGRWLFKSIEDEKLFLLLPKENVKNLAIK